MADHWVDNYKAIGLPFEDEGTFSKVTTERIVYDFVTRGHISPRASVLDPTSLEAAVDRQGYFGWNVPGWEDRLKKTGG